MKVFFKRLGYLILFGILIILYSTFVEPKMLRSDFLMMCHLCKIQGEAIKVVQFSDTHIGDFFYA